MPPAKKREEIDLTDEQTQWLRSIVFSKEEPHSSVVRARILLKYARGEGIHTIARRERVSRPTVQLCIDKALSAGVAVAVRDLPRPGRPAAITPEGEAWVMHIACSNPSEYGCPAESWTLSQLTACVRRHAAEAGHVALAHASKYIIRNIVRESPANVRLGRHYLEIPRYSGAAASVLMIAKDVTVPSGKPAHPPGLTAAQNFSDRVPKSGDVESVCFLVGLDLADGRLVALVRNRNRGNCFAEFLKMTDRHYPAGRRIRIIQGSCPSALSRENMRVLKSHPNRFEFEETRKDSLWISLIDAFFTRLITAFIRSMSVESEENAVRILHAYFSEMDLFAGELTEGQSSGQLQSA